MHRNGQYGQCGRYGRVNANSATGLHCTGLDCILHSSMASSTVLVSYSTCCALQKNAVEWRCTDKWMLSSPSASRPVGQSTPLNRRFGRDGPADFSLRFVRIQSNPIRNGTQWTQWTGRGRGRGRGYLMSSRIRNADIFFFPS